MPKRNPNPGNPRPPQPPVLPPPGDQPPGVRRLYLNLVNLNHVALPELSQLLRVILRDTPPLRVFTPLGTRIGDVSEPDALELKGCRVIASTIYELSLDPPAVVIEVLVL